MIYILKEKLSISGLIYNFKKTNVIKYQQRPFSKIHKTDQTSPSIDVTRKLIQYIPILELYTQKGLAIGESNPDV